MVPEAAVYAGTVCVGNGVVGGVFDESLCAEFSGFEKGVGGEGSVCGLDCGEGELGLEGGRGAGGGRGGARGWWGTGGHCRLRPGGRYLPRERVSIYELTLRGGRGGRRYGEVECLMCKGCCVRVSGIYIGSQQSGL